MTFEDRLKQAISRGEHARSQRAEEAAAEAMTEEELKNRHSAARLELSNHIEACLKSLSDHFPGFRYQTILGEEGWGARINRDDFQIRNRQRNSLYSRFEMVVRPFSSGHILEIVAKGTIRNRELLNRTHFQQLQDLDLEALTEQVDRWALEYAERYASANR